MISVHIPDDIAFNGDPAFDRLKLYAESLPYSIEPNSKMQAMLDFFLVRLAQCILAKDYDPGLLQWDSMLTYWSLLKYPIPKPRRIAIVKLYYELVTTPGLPAHVLSVAADALNVLTRSRKKLSIEDLRLPWKPVYDLLSKELFLSRRKFEINQIPAYMGYIADCVRRFYHPVTADAMLETFLPLFNGTDLDSTLASQYYMLTFLPQSHPQLYLKLLFQLWEGVNSYMFDERMLAFLSQLTELHVDPSLSNPSRVKDLPDDARSPDEPRPDWKLLNSNPHSPRRGLLNESWGGIYSDVGIFNEDEWNSLMCKCLASMEIPLADSGSLTTGPSVDNQAGFEIGRLRKPTWRIVSLARIIVYSMSSDGPSASSTAPTRVGTPIPQRDAGDYLSAPLRRGIRSSEGYLAGCKALDSLAHLIASTESFFHPNNAGSWTADLSAFLKHIVYEFNKRWNEEAKADCKTPMSRRLTKEIKYELVRCLRTVALLAMFSRDSTTTSNIQSCLKSMAIMEPDLIVRPILDRAIPSLEALVETQRTTAVIKALGAVSVALVSRDLYYPGAKYLATIMQLLIPGIDLNDPVKTLCTTAFFIDISQFIKFDDLSLSSLEHQNPLNELENLSTSTTGLFPSEPAPYLSSGDSEKLSRDQEDALLKESTNGFADWITSFIRRIIQLLDNLPEEGANGSQTSGETEVQVVDAVTAACSQICNHLSEPLFDMVLNMIYDYATTNVRSNAVRAVHQLVECVAYSDAAKTLAKFVPFCYRNIMTEIENGASSLRTTSASTLLPSDTTLHWNIAILRGATYNDGTALLKHKSTFMELFNVLRLKTYSKRGYSWTGKLLSSTLLTLTHTYPLETKFVNPNEWNSEEFRKNHHKYWGKLYRPDEVQINWHVPSPEEVEFTLEIFRDLVAPTLTLLENLIVKEVPRDAKWRNDFCRHLTFVRHAFAGIPTLMKEVITEQDAKDSLASSDITNETPEMVASVEPLASCFVLTDDQDPRYQYLSSLKARLGLFLKKASKFLREQGDENMIDAVQILIRCMKTYMLDYGDSKDSYFTQVANFTSEMSLARRHANQKVWPRAVLVRRARYYHTARLRWNSIERRRGAIEDAIIDELVEWAMWHYAVVRQSSQSLLSLLCLVFDGTRRRCIPSFLNAIDGSANHDQLKGALYSLNMPAFAKYAMSEPIFSNTFIMKLFGCQLNPKPSIQKCIASLWEICLSSMSEPSLLAYDIENLDLSRVANELLGLIASNMLDEGVLERCLEQRKRRLCVLNQCAEDAIPLVTKIADSPGTHWRYSIIAIRFLRSLMRKDAPLSQNLAKFFLRSTHDAHPSMRYYGQRAVMKGLRYIKLRSLCKNSVDLVLERNKNPLSVDVEIVDLSINFTARYLYTFREKVKRNTEIFGQWTVKGSPRLDSHQHETGVIQETTWTSNDQAFQDKIGVGWLAWAPVLRMYKLPFDAASAFQPWDTQSQDAIRAIRETVTDEKYWRELASQLAEENQVEVVTQDNISSVKSIFQLLEIEPFHVLLPILEEYLADKAQHKQRAAAELLAGLIGGSKHWPLHAQKQLWEWFGPQMPKILGAEVKTDTVLIWTSFLEYLFANRDPRRLQPLVDYLLEQFFSLDFNSESFFEIMKVLSFMQALYEQLGWRFTAWANDCLKKYLTGLDCEHDLVRAYVSEALEFVSKIKRKSILGLPKTASCIVADCLESKLVIDPKGSNDCLDEIMRLVPKLSIWRQERLPGARALQSTYDKVAITICRWLFLSLHDMHAASTFPLILPLVPELFWFSEVNDNDDLNKRASALLVRMCGVVPPKGFIGPILEAIFTVVRSSPSWKVRLKALPLIQIFYFRQAPLIPVSMVSELLEVVCKCLDDEVLEVREMAATTLSGILRLSPRRHVATLKDRFARLAQSVRLPGRESLRYEEQLRKLHAAILGVCAIVDSYPYTVEKWMPALLTDVLVEHSYDPLPISTAIRNCASNFKKTHLDTWHEDSKVFTEDQLSALSGLLTGSSYYA